MRKGDSDAIKTVAAASGGLLVGAIGMAAVVWGFPNAMRSPNPGGQHRAERPLAADGKNQLPLTKAPMRSSTTTPSIEADPLAELRDRQLEFPVRGALRRDLRDSFYETRDSTRTHEAIDIMAPRNTPILAVEGGTIARLFESKAGGTTIYQFDPTTRYAYYYAHLERYADGLREGNHVQRGQVLGYVGTSGNAPKDSPHLHFAIFRLTDKKQWWRGSPINPYEVLK
jgi:murein DD-endopeptidase MepM/ murein hydrolase activator NlpD